MPRKKSPKKKSEFNKFFDKIFVINLFDKTKRWKKVSSQFKRRGITVERFIAIDGRCKSQGDKACAEKLKTFEMIYDVKIPANSKKLNGKIYPLKELVPASSLTIGTILLLRAQVKNKWKHMLICEDDIELSRNVEKKFKQGVSELPKSWDLLYLGCGNMCGNNGIDDEYSRKNKYESQLNEFMGEEVYVQYKNDLRYLCDEKCKPITEHLSIAYNPGGTWCYAYSLKGARKMLKLLGKNAGEHIDQLIGEQTKKKKMKAIAFDPPIVMHEGGALRNDSDIPWEW